MFTKCFDTFSAAVETCMEVSRSLHDAWDGLDASTPERFMLGILRRMAAPSSGVPTPRVAYNIFEGDTTLLYRTASGNVVVEIYVHDDGQAVASIGPPTTGGSLAARLRGEGWAEDAPQPSQR